MLFVFILWYDNGYFPRTGTPQRLSQGFLGRTCFCYRELHSCHRWGAVISFLWVCEVMGAACRWLEPALWHDYELFNHVCLQLFNVSLSHPHSRFNELLGSWVIRGEIKYCIVLYPTLCHYIMNRDIGSPLFTKWTIPHVGKNKQWSGVAAFTIACFQGKLRL